MSYRFDIIGEHQSEPCSVLVLDEAGQHYTWDLELAQVRPLAQVRLEEWRLDADRDRVAARLPDGSR